MGIIVGQRRSRQADKPPHPKTKEQPFPPPNPTRRMAEVLKEEAPLAESLSEVWDERRNRWA